MGELADWFVGGVACLLGLALTILALVPTSPVFQLPKVRWLERQVGRSLTLIVVGVVGVVLVVVGIAIIRGWKLNLL
jgi:hypothetical protein